MTTPPHDRFPVVLFDLDGTITDSAPGIHNGFRHALAAVGAPEPSETLLGAVVGPPMVDTFRSLGFTPDQVETAIAAYFDYYDATGWSENTVFDGMPEVLAKTQANGTRLAVATSKSERFAVRILDHFGLSENFEFIGAASNDGSRRAKADVIAHSLSALGITPSADTAGVLMVGDRDHDVLGAAQFGIPAVFVDWGYGSDAEARGSYRRVETAAELEGLLDGNQ
ncbi:phosphoglycolate phosphatase [Rhodococcus sp. 27YEA15]|uniref:HAD hydrolase-like protein n=1 Tax=Rhodococcus sp. 27YEA15 TaxID=3156259 RepID=UPI003C7D7793